MAQIRPSYCQDCKKRTYLTEEAVQQRIRDTLLLHGTFLSAYRCPARIYGFHVRNIEKRLARRGKDGERGKLKREYTLLLQFLQSAKIDHSKAAVQPGRAAALDRALRALRPTTAPVCHSVKKLRRARVRHHRQRDTARVGLPRGELVTRMIGYWRGGSYDLRDQHPRHGNGDLLRRRNRARETEAVRREITREMPELTCVEIGCHPRFHDRSWDMNDEYTAPSDEVWHALSANDVALGSIDFNGVWTCES